jgi:hypothetical protein
MGRPKLAQVKEVFPVRLPDERRRALQAEAATREGTPSEVIRLHLERYAEIVWRDLPKMTEYEWCATFEAVASMTADAAAIAWAGMTVARAIEETDLARKWGVNAKELGAAARAWTFGQCCAVSDATVRFQRALASGTERRAAVQEATTRPAALVLEAPARRKAPARRRARNAP